MAQNPQLLEFIGPSAQNFATFYDQAFYSLTTYCKNWNNKENPRSYILPPIFRYKNSDIGDDAYAQIEESETAKGQNAIIKFRESDLAEHMIYKAVYALTVENFQAPFIVVQNLDLNTIRYQLPLIFRSMNRNIPFDIFQTCFREYDFLIIGPKVGIIVIEVKHARFSQNKDFASGRKFFPAQYKHGLDQLFSIDTFCKFLQECNGVPLDDTKIRKILFTPNLKRQRFDDWLRSLCERSRSHIQALLGETILWFEEDARNAPDHQDKPPLYCKLKEAVSSAGYEISDKLYEAYATLIAGFASIAILKGKKIIVNPNLISENAAIVVENERIQLQDLRRSQSTRATALDGIQNVISKVIFLTPDQQRALHGVKKQFLIGAAGTGKTIIMQLKILELLQNEQSVLIFSTKNYKEYYKELCEGSGAKREKYAVKKWDTTSEMIFFAFPNFRRLAMYDGAHLFHEIFQAITTTDDNELRAAVDILFQYDHVFIDDSLEITSFSSRDWRQYFITILTVVHYVNDRNRFVWIAGDFHFRHMNNEVSSSSRNGFEKTIQAFLEFYSSDDCNKNYQLTVLRRVMRCPEQVFHIAYNSSAAVCPALYPAPGHKVQGIHKFLSIQSGMLNDELLQRLWMTIVGEIQDIRAADNLSLMSNIAVIVKAYKTIYWSTETNSTIYHNTESLAETCREHLESTLPSDELRGGTVTVGSWHDVSSLEWPIVILAFCVPSNWRENRSILQSRYRAASRSTAKLIEIFATFECHWVPASSSRQRSTSATSVAIRQRNSY